MSASTRDGLLSPNRGGDDDAAPGRARRHAGRARAVLLQARCPDWSEGVRPGRRPGRAIARWSGVAPIGRRPRASASICWPSPGRSQRGHDSLDPSILRYREALPCGAARSCPRRLRRPQSRSPGILATPPNAPSSRIAGLKRAARISLLVHCPDSARGASGPDPPRRARIAPRKIAVEAIAACSTNRRCGLLSTAVAHRAEPWSFGRYRRQPLLRMGAGGRQAPRAASTPAPPSSALSRRAAALPWRERRCGGQWGLCYDYFKGVAPRSPLEPICPARLGFRVTTGRSNLKRSNSGIAGGSMMISVFVTAGNGRGARPSQDQEARVVASASRTCLAGSRFADAHASTPSRRRFLQQYARPPSSQRPTRFSSSFPPERASSASPPCSRRGRPAGPHPPGRCRATPSSAQFRAVNFY